MGDSSLIVAEKVFYDWNVWKPMEMSASVQVKTDIILLDFCTI